MVLEIIIQDNGAGISQEGVKQLFKDFKKLSENEMQNKQGTGLGLSICKQIIEQMGGKVVCRSKIGVGTEFKITLPVQVKSMRVKSNRNIDRRPSIFAQRQNLIIEKT